MQRIFSLPFIVFAVLASLPCEAQQQVMSRKQFQEMQAIQRQQQMLEAAKKRNESLEKQRENNVRALCALLDDAELQKKLKISDKQKKTFDELDKKLEEERKKITNPEDRRFATPEDRREYIKTKIPDLQELNLKCGKVIKEVLTEEQLNAYGRQMTYDRAKRAWEKRMGIEPEEKKKKEN